MPLLFVVFITDCVWNILASFCFDLHCTAFFMNIFSLETVESLFESCQLKDFTVSVVAKTAENWILMSFPFCSHCQHKLCYIPQLCVVFKLFVFFMFLPFVYSFVKYFLKYMDVRIFFLIQNVPYCMFVLLIYFSDHCTHFPSHSGDSVYFCTVAIRSKIT